MFIKPNITQVFAHDERDRQIRYEQNIFDTLCKEIPIPLAEVPKISSNATHEQTLQAVDEYMRRLIACYSPTTQSRLNLICFGNPGTDIKWHPDLLIKYNNGAEAVAEMQAYLFSEKNAANPEFNVILGSMFKETPLLRKLILIHEAVCHLGQELEIFEMSKRASPYPKAIKNFIDIDCSKARRLFIEMTAARVEKAIWDTIPLSVLEAEIRNVSNSEARSLLTIFTNDKRSYTYFEMARLEHRSEAKNVSSFEIDRMNQVPGVRSFDKRATRPSLRKAKNAFTKRQNLTP